MSCAAKYTFTICQGSTTDFVIQYTDITGSMVNLSDYGAKMQLRDTPGGSTLYLTLSSSLQADGTGLNFSGSARSSTGLVSPVSGTIGVYISMASSSLLSFDKADYDLFIYSGSFSDKILEGVIRLDKKVTVV